MAQQAVVEVVVAKRGNGRANGVVHDGKVHKIGEKFTASKSDAQYLIATGKCVEATKAEKPAEKK